MSKRMRQHIVMAITGIIFNLVGCILIVKRALLWAFVSNIVGLHKIYTKL